MHIFNAYRNSEMKLTTRLRNDCEIVKTLALNELKIKYKRNMLGFLWSMLNPILTISIISVVFSTLMDMKFTEFMLFLFPAFLAWNLFANSVNSSSLSLVTNENLIKKISINKLIFPSVSVTVSLIDYILSFLSLFLLAAILGYEFSLSLLTLPVAIILLLMFSTGFAFLISIATAHWRDMSHLFGVFLQFWFYLTPILYPKAKLTSIPLLLEINPMVLYMDMFRMPVFEATFPPAGVYIKAALISSSVFFLGYVLFKRYEDNIVHRL